MQFHRPFFLVQTKYALQESPAKKKKTKDKATLPIVDHSGNGLLHLYCQKPALNSVQMFGMIVHHFPDAIRTRFEIQKANPTRGVGRGHRKQCWWNRQDQHEKYMLPINIAISNNASVEVLEVLVSSDSEVLELKDGRDGACSLGIALQSTKQFGNNEAVLDFLVQANPKCVSLTDKRFNYPLHIACSVGSSLRVVQSLYRLNREVLLKKNINGETPLALAQRNSFCSEDVLNFLEANAFREY